MVIGIDDYLRVADVPGASADAKLVRDFLVYSRGIPPARVRMLTTGASREVILGALQDMGHQVSAGGTLWFYFAGHGGASPSGERLLLGDDVPTAPEALQARSVLLSEVKKFGASGGGQVMVVVDACFNGATRTGGNVIEAGTRFVVPQAAVATQRGIAEWSAAGPSELARPLPGGGHGAFTYFWVGAGRGWADGQLDGKRDGVVSAEEAHEYIIQALATVGLTQQSPVLTTDSPKSWTLAKGAKEVGPDFSAMMPAPEPAPVVYDIPARTSTGGTDFASLAAEAARADADAKAAAARAERSKRALEDERGKRLDEARSALLTKATRDWGSVSPLLGTAGPATKKVVEMYVSTYGEATVSLDDTVIVVPVPQVEEARGWLATQDRASFAADASGSGGKRLTASVPSGTRVRIEDVSSSDAYFSGRDSMVGLICRTNADSNVNGDGWHGGPVTCDNGQDYYFYQAAYVLAADATSSAKATISTTAGRRIEKDIPEGTRIRIDDISAEDAYYPGKDYIGLTCTAGDGMTHNGGGYHGGPVSCDDGQSFYFYKAAMVALDSSGSAASPAASPSAPAYSSGTTASGVEYDIPGGTQVTILGISSEDAYYPGTEYIGLTCTIMGGTTHNGGGYHGGQASCSDGSSPYFYKAAMAPVGGKGGGGKKSKAVRARSAVPSGTSVKVVELSKDDGYYADRSSIVGLSCTTSDTTSYNGDGWHGGEFACGNGEVYYFYKAALEISGSGGSGQDLGDKVADGVRVRIVDIGPGDLYEAEKDDFVGKSCSVSGDLHRNDGTYYGGGLTCEGTYWYFAGVAVEKR